MFIDNGIKRASISKYVCYQPCTQMQVKVLDKLLKMTFERSMCVRSAIQG